MDDTFVPLSARDIFSRVRLEQDQQPVYFLPSILGELELPRPRYLVGTRGSGKTSLLKAMHWSERLSNTSLRSQLGPNPFADHYVGLYLKLPEIQLTSVDRWLADTDDPTVFAGIFSVYLESVWLQLAADAIARMAASRMLTIDPERECAVLDRSIVEYDEYPLFNARPSLTLPTLRRMLHKVQRHIERSATHRRQPVDVADELPIDIGRLGRDLGSALSGLCVSADNLADDSSGHPWRLHVCLDEAEILSERQQRTLNTIMRLSTAPVYYLASFVGTPANMVQTYLPNLTLSSPDVAVTDRDKIPSDDFYELSRGVVQARLDAVLKSDAEPIDLKQLLGEPSLNQLVAAKIAESENPRTEDLLEDARQWSAILGSDLDPDADSDKGSLPIIEAYAVRRKEGELPALARDELRRYQSSYVRKNRVTAYLALLRELHMRPIYAGWDIFSNVADSCVRDLLWQMDALLSQMVPGVEDPAAALKALLARGRNYEKQSLAIRSAAQDKMARARTTLTYSPEPASRLITALAERLGKEARERQQLDAEPGLYRLAVEGSVDAETARTLVRECAEAGYLKLEQRTPVEWLFRLHNSLAPAFGLSWRRGYRTSKVTSRQILDMAQVAVPDANRPPRPTVSTDEGQTQLDLPSAEGDR